MIASEKSSNCHLSEVRICIFDTRCFPLLPLLLRVSGKYTDLFVLCLQRNGLEMFFILLEFFFCLCCATGNHVAPCVLSERLSYTLLSSMNGFHRNSGDDCVASN